MPYSIIQTKMKFRQTELDACGVTQEEIEECLRILKEKLDPSIVRDIEARDELDITTIIFLFNRAKLVDSLSSKPGFGVIKREIIRYPKASLYEPHGQWFQLTVANFFNLAGEKVAFEQKCRSSQAPKDITLRDGEIIIECKSFSVGAKLMNTIGEYLNYGKLPSKNPDCPDSFNKKLGFLGFPFMFFGDVDEHGITWITVNEYQRFFSNAIAEKYGQLIVGACNIIACNVGQFCNNIAQLRKTLVELLSSNDFSRISGILLVNHLGIGQEDYKMKGQLRFVGDLIENPADGVIKIPKNLAQALFVKN